MFGGWGDSQLKNDYSAVWVLLGKKEIAIVRRLSLYSYFVRVSKRHVFIIAEWLIRLNDTKGYERVIVPLVRNKTF